MAYMYIISLLIILYYIIHFRFPNDHNTWSIDRQFMVGPGLLITPVLDEVYEINCLAIIFLLYNYIYEK